MAIKSSRSQSTYRTHSLRFPVAVIFILTIFALAVNRMFQEPQLFPWSQLDWLCFGGGYLGLVLAEMLEGKVYPRRLIFPVRLLLLGVRLIFILSIYWVDGGKTSLPIFSVFLYALYFHLGAVPTLLALAANIWALYVWSPVLHVNLGEQVAYTSILVLFASQIQHDDRIRMRNQELTRELENYAANSTSLAKQEERNRISRDLHDRLGHYLVAVNIQLQKAAAYREINPAESDQAVQQAQQATAEAIRELRQTLGNLREMDAPTDFRAELQKLIDGVQQNGLPVTLTIQGSEENYSDLVRLTLRQAVQEGLTNVEKHARASQVQLTLNFGRRWVNLTLQDDGVGFLPEQLDETSRYGLSGLRERVSLVRGSLKIESRVGKGTKLKISIPRKLVE